MIMIAGANFPSQNRANRQKNKNKCPTNIHLSTNSVGTIYIYIVQCVLFPFKLIITISECLNKHK